MLDFVITTTCAFLTHPIGFLLGLLIVSFLYTKHKLSYFERIGIPGPKPLPFVGNTLEAILGPLSQKHLANKKYGSIYGMYFGHMRAVVISEPELIKQVLVKDFHKYTDRFEWKANQPTWDLMLFAAGGEDWKRLRALSSPTFSSGKMKKMYPMIQECTELLVDAVGKIVAQNNEIDLKKVFANLTMDAICSCAFATKTNTHSDPNNILVSTSYRLLNRTRLDQLEMLAFIVFPYLRKLLKISFVNAKAMSTFEKVIKEIISRRKQQKSDKKQNDFLQLMIDSAEKGNLPKEEDETGLDSESHHINNYKEVSMASSSITKKPLTEAELIAQCFIFIVAGYETTATLLSYLFYSLSLNEACQERLVEEIKLSENEKGEISYDTLAKMPYLDACISEALRLYNPVVFLERHPIEDTKLGDVELSKGMAVHVPVYAIHHNEKYHPEPFKFNPDRFLPENRHKIVPYTYLPFGAGPRNCIGLRFALMEAKLATVRVLRDFRFMPNHKTQIPIRFKTGNALLLQCHNLIVGVERR